MLQVFDIDELIKPRKEAAKKKMMDELRDETTESAISKITAAVQTQQLEAAEDEDERKSGALRGQGGLQCEKVGDVTGTRLGSLSSINHKFWARVFRTKCHHF